MKRKRAVIRVASEEDLTTNATDTNWSLCALCQRDTQESLTCPVRTTRSNYGSGYDLLATNIIQFAEIDSLPMDINISRLDEGSGVLHTLKSNLASWHISCFRKFSDLKLERARRCKERHGRAVSPVGERRTSRRRMSSGDKDDKPEAACFFCDKSDGKMHRVATSGIDRNVRQIAFELQDSILISKLQEGDMFARDAIYHKNCLTSLYNRRRSKSSSTERSSSDEILEGIALAELISYIENQHSADDTVSLFKLSDLVKLYETRLRTLGARVPARINSTRLKDRLMCQMPQLRAHQQGRDLLLGFDDEVGDALKIASQSNYDDEGILLSKAANLIRRDIFSVKNEFTGSFDENSMSSSVPNSVLAFVSMILFGVNIQDRASSQQSSNASSTISQLLIFNAVKRVSESQIRRHVTDRETPLPIYIGLSIHAHTREKKLVEKFHRLGLSISYFRVMQLSTDIGNTVCKRYTEENVVCPPSLRNSFFTTSCVDNIDHNPSSGTAMDSFHGTAISLTQHPHEEYQNSQQSLLSIDASVKSKKLLSLPAFYTNIPPVAMNIKNFLVPKLSSLSTTESHTVLSNQQKEKEWLLKVYEHTAADLQDQSQDISWSAFHASVQPPSQKPTAITALLPLFDEYAQSFEMIKHSICLIKGATERINPGQTPVISMDQPLFSIAKQIQWAFPDEFGEHKCVIMMGGLHIEMAVLRMLGKWLRGSGWTSALVESSMISSGRADSLLKASHVKRTRYAHQVTAAALYILQRRAYDKYIEENTERPDCADFQKWIEEKSLIHPQFYFWNVTLNLELLTLQYIRALRIGDFTLYVETLEKLVIWFFSLDMSNYARWLPIHIRDMLSLSSQHPRIYDEFCRGNFVVKKTERAFSLIALDHNHEQLNAMIKGEGGAIGLTEDPLALQRWMISGPEIARIVRQFETHFLHRDSGDTRHHEQSLSAQKSFMSNTKALVERLESMGNPFLEDSSDLVALDTKEIMSQEVVKSIMQVEQLGIRQYHQFIKDVFENQTKLISDTLHRNNLKLFGSALSGIKVGHAKVQSLRNDSNLFSRLYIVSQSRDGDLSDFFRHENQAFPPSLSNNGRLRQGKKSDLIHCLNLDSQTVAPDVDAKILDGSVVVNLINTNTLKTFEDFAFEFSKYVEQQLRYVNRIDIVFDTYSSNSLKEGIREARGSGIRQRVSDKNKLPTNWRSFLRNSDNKKELFEYLAHFVKSSVSAPNKEVLVTLRDSVITSSPADISGISPCNHEEADTRILLHVSHAVKAGHSKVLVRTVDTDVLVLCLSSLHKLSGVRELWVGLGVGKHFRFIPVHAVRESSLSSFLIGLPFFHAFTGCDTVSCFHGCSKGQAFQVWKQFPSVTPIFEALTEDPHEIDETELQILERFVVLLYSKTCSSDRVNDARQILFSRQSRLIENIPPTQAALRQHIKRSTLQAGYIWSHCLTPQIEAPNPSDWGWKRGEDGRWYPYWSEMPEASTSMQILTRCGCKKRCASGCKCKRANLSCTDLCFCGGSC